LQIHPAEQMRPLLSLSLAALVTSGGVAGASPAPAWQSGTIELELRLPDGNDGFEPKSDVENREHFNRANCLCPDVEFAVRFSLADVPGSLDPDPVRVWFGTNCDSSMVSERDQTCTQQYEFTDVEALRDPQTVPFSVQALTGSCDPNENERDVYALIDNGNDGIDTEAGDYASMPLAITADTRPPPAPLDISAAGGEGAVQVSWTLPDTNIEDVKYFQVLCARADGSVNDDDDFPRMSARYLTSADACGLADPTVCPRAVSVSRVTPAGIDAGAIDAAPAADAGAVECTGDMPGELETLGTMHVCGEADGTESSVRVDGLENGVAYRIVLVVIDPSRNPTALDLGEHTPSPVKDFWEHYHDRGGTAEGGCDLVGKSSGVAAALVVVLAVVLFAPGRRRRQIGGGLILLVASARIASAQPWWESAGDDVQKEVGAAPVHWDFEIKFGPYVPAVDSEFDLADGEVGPFEQMFGDGPFLMSGMTLDYYFLYPAGQLGLTGSLGFMTKSARAFQVDDSGDVVTNDDGVPIRASGDSNKFRLIPMSLGVVYRYTQLDDLYHIMVVPYGRFGLSYYAWWVTAPSGDIAEVPTSDCPDLEDCTGDKARGGSLGWQATGGLALRLERIDREAEVALRTELGIEHAGFMVEYTYAVVDGFGSDKKLSVGDSTWFGGINFEF
jgi:hypothetical protein